VSAFLQSIMPAPVMVRNFEISAIVTAIIVSFKIRPPTPAGNMGVVCY